MPTGNDIEYEDENGIVRCLGNLRPKKEPTGKKYGVVKGTPIFDRKDWTAFIDRNGTGPEVGWLPPVHDQSRTNMCNCSATAGAMENQRFKQGLTYQKLSAADLYRRICGGVDQGSMLQDGLAEATKNGIATVSTVPYLDWQNNYPAAKAQRAVYRVVDAYLCPDFAACISAVIQGYDLVSGIEWYSKYNPKDDGWLPGPTGQHVGGHAVHGYKATYRKRGGKTEYGIWHQNSWGPSWGLGGRCVFPESVYEEGNIGGWWAVVQMVEAEEE